MIEERGGHHVSPSAKIEVWWTGVRGRGDRGINSYGGKRGFKAKRVSASQGWRSPPFGGSQMDSRITVGRNVKSEEMSERKSFHQLGGLKLHE